MLGRRVPRPSAPETAVPDGVLTLAVFHRSDDIERQVAPLKLATGIRLEFFKKGSLWRVPTHVGGVLWELAPDDGSHRFVSALIGSVPAASFSSGGQPAMSELSNALGFRAHLATPLRLDDVERALGLREAIDLADRIEAAAPGLMRLASQPETIEIGRAHV